MASEDVRIDVLKRLAEQAMSDDAFRESARHDLDGALVAYGYELNERERALVFRFRSALEEAGIDLFLTEELSKEHQAILRGL